MLRCCRPRRLGLPVTISDADNLGREGDLLFLSHFDSSATALEIKDQVLDLIFHTKCFFPSPTLVLLSCTLALLAETILEPRSKIPHTFFYITSHTLVTLLLGLGA